jgi:DNA-binding transcriptional regulator GbsR (MarR family)
VPDGPSAPAGSKDPLLSYIERFTAVLVAAGFPPMPARVFVALLVADSGGLTAADLAGTLQISPAAVSGAVRYLIPLGLVQKERVPGSRRDCYQAPGDVWGTLMRQREQVMARWIGMLHDGVGLVGADTAAGQRLAEHVEFLEFVTRQVGDVVERWEKLRTDHGDVPPPLVSA